MQQICSSDNVADLFTKSSSNCNVQKDGAQAWNAKIQVFGMMLPLGGVNTRCTLFSSQGFVPLGFPCKVFNEAS